MKAQKTSRARRNFLLSLSGVGAGVAIVVVTKRAPDETVLNTPAQAEKDSYRLSEHVKKYYRTARTLI